MSANQWSQKQLHFQLWLALPPSDREPATQQELAAVLRVHETTLVRWKKLDGFLDQVKKAASETLDWALIRAYTSLGKRLEQEARLDDLRFVHQLLGYQLGDKKEAASSTANPSVIVVQSRWPPQ